MPTTNYNEADIRKYVSLSTLPVELRLICSKGIHHGFFDDPEILVKHLALLSNGGDKIQAKFGQIKGIYTTLNPVDLNKRQATEAVDDHAPLRITNSLKRAGIGEAADDEDIARRVLLPLDFDPVKNIDDATNHMATAEERELAIAQTVKIREYLKTQGFPEPCFSDSGNGGHLLYRIDLENTAENTELIHRFLTVIKSMVDPSKAKGDTTIGNAARIWKAYGTKVCKGIDNPEIGRVHRLANILECPATLGIVPVALIRAIADQIPAEPPKPTAAEPATDKLTLALTKNMLQAENGKMADFIAKHVIELRGKPKQTTNRIMYVLKACPFNAEHNKGEAALFVHVDGPGFKCQHDSCETKTWKDVRQHFEPDSEPAQQPKTNGKPQIITGGDVARMTDLALGAMYGRNEPVPSLFLSGGLITERMAGTSFEQITDNRMLRILSESANWRRKGKGGELFESGVPIDVRKSIFGEPRTRFPELKHVISTPVFLSDGTLLSVPGYHAGSQTWFEPSVVVPPVSSVPTALEVARAKHLLEFEVLGDFPFADQSSKAHAVALNLLPFCRQMIDGPTPFHLIDAPTEGTGKGLVAKVFALISTGLQTESIPNRGTDAEMRKSITANFCEIKTYLYLDNIPDNSKLDYPSLATVLTEAIWKDRLLCKSKMCHFQILCIFLATGNNVQMSPEIQRRTVRIRIDANSEKPSARTGFRHPNLLQYIAKNRGELVWACLTLVQSWLAAGRPFVNVANVAKGSYESWVPVIGGILEHAGISGFLENENTAFDTIESDWKPVVRAWWLEYGRKPIGVDLLIPLCQKFNLLPDITEERNPGLKMANALKTQLERVYDGKKIMFERDTHKKANVYYLAKLETKNTVDVCLVASGLDFQKVKTITEATATEITDVPDMDLDLVPCQQTTQATVAVMVPTVQITAEATATEITDSDIFGEDGFLDMDLLFVQSWKKLGVPPQG